MPGQDANSILRDPADQEVSRLELLGAFVAFGAFGAFVTFESHKEIDRPEA